VSAVGAVGLQTIGNNHNSPVMMGHWSWVTRVMGHFADGSDGSCVTKCDPLSALIETALSLEISQELNCKETIFPAKHIYTCLVKLVKIYSFFSTTSYSDTGE